MPRFICWVLLLLAIPVAHAGAEEPEAVPAEVSEAWFENPLRSRGFLSHTALPLHSGEGFIGQQGVFITSAEVGLGERVSLNVASAMPFMLVGGSPFGGHASELRLNVLAGLKVAVPVSERVHLAFGVQGGAAPMRFAGVGDVYAINPYGVLTYGTGDSHLSVSLQSAYIVGTFNSGPDVLLIPTVSGFMRLGEHWGLAAEALTLLPLAGQLEPGGLVMGGPRFLGQHWSVDLGVIAAQEWDAFTRNRLRVLPWASFMFHWS
ncbi:MAG TPA: hypothetical protein VE153_15805 [Myxococcus sp.]|nr:hypothetical protein [Myxococcus sp.]